MVMDLFESMLQEIGQVMNIKDLHPDEHNTCLIRFKIGLDVQIEPYTKGEFLLIGCPVCTIPQGRFRESVFREALKANGMTPPRHGDFGYSPSSDRLILFAFLPLQDLNGEKVASFLGPFMEKALNWKQLIERGDVPIAETLAGGAVQSRRGIFSLIR